MGSLGGLVVKANGPLIKQLRTKARLTQPELAAKIGTVAQRVGKIERGQQGIGMVLLRKFAEALNVDVELLIWDDERDRAPAPGEFTKEWPWPIKRLEDNQNN